MIVKLVLLADIYCTSTGHSRAAVSKVIFSRGGHFDDLASGSRDLSTGTFERALAWFSANWPEDAAWPEDVPRPLISEPAE